MRRALALTAMLLGVATTVRAQDFRPVVQQLARGWQRGDVSMLSSHTASMGLSLDVEGRRLGPLPGRQAVAALSRLLDERETVSVSTGMQKEMEGSPRRAFAELNWVTRPRGTTIPQRTTIFVALELERDRWRITEIRLMK
jgi:hypothetical protein